MDRVSDRARLIDGFRNAGHELWIVGGALRDEFLGLAGGDEDFATGALPDEVEALALGLGFKVTTVGKRFGTIGVLLDGRWSEITTYRGESYTNGSRWPDVTFGTSIQEDLARRDFTVNAMAESALTSERLDPFGGERDVHSRRIRAVGEPVARFREDPLRILRGVRLASQLDFEVHDETVRAMTETAPLLASLSQERITTELGKLLEGRNPARGLQLLRTTGALGVVLPEFAPMVGCEQNRFHRLDVWGHTVATVAAIQVDEASRRRRRWAAFLHDLGKPYVRHVKANGEWGFYGHEVDGAERATSVLNRLRVARKDADVLALLVRRHMDRPNPEDAKSVRRFMAKAEGYWEDLLALKRADNASHTYDDAPYMDALEDACRRVAEVDAEALRARSPLTGDDLAVIAGREPGPWIRPVKEALSAMVLDGDIEPGDRAAAERAARAMLGGETPE